MKADTAAILSRLLVRYPALSGCRRSIEEALALLIHCFEGEGRLYICGNGGSASDAQHITGELMKSFVLKRQIPHALAEKIRSLYPKDAEHFLSSLQGALPAYSLTGQSSLCTAFINDVCADMVFAQQVSGYVRKGDAVWGISTSGNAANVINALKVANALNAGTIALTGAAGGQIKRVSTVTISVPETETYKVQELHLPVYHAICLMLENEFFSQE